MTEKEKKIIEEKIAIDINKIQSQINILKEKIKPVAPDCSLDKLSREEVLTQQIMDKKILNEAELTLIRLQNSKKRISHELFGFCVECDQTISIERMLIRPESIRCVNCAN